jgi:hypothetical protein
VDWWSGTCIPITSSLDILVPSIISVVPILWDLVQFDHERKLTDYALDFLLERDDGSQTGSFLAIEEQWTVIWPATALARWLDYE